MTPEQRSALLDRLLAEQEAAMQAAPQQNGPPEGYFANPTTGQMTSRDLLRNHKEQTGQTSVGGAAGSGFAQGTAFNYADEIAGLVGRVEGGPDMARFRREEARAGDEAQRGAHPYAYTGGEIAGAVNAAIPTVPYAAGGNVVARGGALGMAEGFAHGTGRGEGAADRLAKGSTDAAIGAAAGIAAPYAVEGARRVYRGVTDPVIGVADSLLGRANPNRANRAMMSTVNRSGMTPRQLDSTVAAAARDGQPEYRMMDALGRAGQRRASGLARAGGDAAEEIETFLMERQGNALDRTGSYVDDAFDLGGGTAKSARELVKQGRDEAADLNFDAIRARGEPVDTFGVVRAIDEQLEEYAQHGMQHPAATQLKKLRADLSGTARDGANAVLSDFDRVFLVRKNLRDTIERLGNRSGWGSVPVKSLKSLRGALDDAMQASSGDYRQAMQDFAQSSRVMDAFETGARASRPGQRGADTAAEFAPLSGSEQAAMRVGYGDRLAAKLEANAAQAPDAARPLRSTKVRAESDAMAIDPALLSRRIGRETDMYNTHNAAVGGSRTVGNDADVAEAGGDAAGGVIDALTGQFSNLLKRGAGKIAPLATGQSDETRRLMVEMMLSQNPSQALAPALQQSAQSELQKRLIESMLRGNMMRAISGATGP